MSVKKWDPTVDGPEIRLSPVEVGRLSTIIYDGF